MKIRGGPVILALIKAKTSFITTRPKCGHRLNKVPPIVTLSTVARDTGYANTVIERDRALLGFIKAAGLAGIRPKYSRRALGRLCEKMRSRWPLSQCGLPSFAWYVCLVS
jgi:hypothetical protein